MDNDKNYLSGTIEPNYEGFQQYALQLLQFEKQETGMLSGLDRLRDEISLLDRYIAIDDADVTSCPDDEADVFVAEAQRAVYQDIATTYEAHVKRAYELLRDNHDEGSTLRARIGALEQEHTVLLIGRDLFYEVFEVSLKMAAYSTVRECYSKEFADVESILMGNDSPDTKMSKILERQTTFRNEFCSEDDSNIETGNIEARIRLLAITEALPLDQKPTPDQTSERIQLNYADVAWND
ncbi:hypothetical protein HYV86_01340 [Candidatus Woesearchaeota archaeon]|nr:hypothetical protein [Candidatus Woesearchaeota archaeon]